MKYLVTIVGLVLILEGLPYLTFPETMQNWMLQLTEIDPRHLRLIGLIAVGIGLLLCFITQRTGFVK